MSETRIVSGRALRQRAERAETEVARLRRWLEYAARNMTYPYVQVALEEALSDAALPAPPRD